MQSFTDRVERLRGGTRGSLASRMTLVTLVRRHVDITKIVSEACDGVYSPTVLRLRDQTRPRVRSDRLLGRGSGTRFFTALCRVQLAGIAIFKRRAQAPGGSRQAVEPPAQQERQDRDGDDKGRIVGIALRDRNHGDP